MNKSQMVKNSAVVTIVGAILALMCTFAYIGDSALVYITTGFGLLTRVAKALGFVLITIGLYGLWESSAINRETGLAKVGFGLSVVGQVLVIAFTLTRNNTLAIVSSIVLGVGMIVLGTAVLQANRWDSWRKYIILIFGLAPIASIFLYPIAESISPDAPDHVLSAIVIVIWLLFGMALWIESNSDSVSGKMS